VSLEDVARSRRVVAPSGTVVWRLPDRRELAVLWQVTEYWIVCDRRHAANQAG